MRRLFQFKDLFRFIAVLSILSFTVSSFAGVAGMPRIIPQGKITVLEGKNKVGTLTAEMPLPEKKILKVEGTCGVKLDTVNLIAQDKTTFAMATEKDADNLLLHKGRVYFVISSLPKKLVVATPDGMIVANRVIQEVDSQEGKIQGYVDVTESGTGIGIIKGGAVVIATREGEKTLTSGNHYNLTSTVGLKAHQVEVSALEPPQPPEEAYPAGLGSSGLAWAIVGLVGVVIVAAIASDDGDPVRSSISPVMPPP